MTEPEIPRRANGEPMMKIPDALRASALLLIWVVMLVVVYLIQPTNLPTLAAKLLCASAGLNLGFYADRWIFPYSRCGDIADMDLRWRYEYRRAAIMVGTAIALSMGYG